MVLLDVKMSSLRPLMVQPVYFGRGDAEKRIDETVNDMSSVLGELVSFLQPAIVPDARSAVDLKAYISPHADALLAVNLPVWAEALAYLNLPIIVWPRRGYYGAWLRDKVSFLRSKGATVYDFVDPDEAREIVRALRTVARLRHSKIIYFGAMPGSTGRFEAVGVVGSCWNLDEIKKRFGVTVKQIPISYLLKRMDEVSEEEAMKILEEWKKDFVDLKEEDLKKLLEVAKLYKAMESIMSEHGANALTINCLADLFQTRFITPCIALAKFSDAMIPAGCEGDLNTLLTMMLFSFMSDEPSIMGNIYLFRPERGPGFPPEDIILEDTKVSLRENRARFTHDVIPLKIVTSKYRLADYHGTGKGLTAYADLRIDEKVTLGRIDPRLDRIVFTVADIEKVEDSVHCRFSAWLKMPDIKAYLQNISSHHSAMIYGDWTSTLIRVSEMLGLQPVVIRRRT
ncbi:MAG TPA: hypothetical protein ENG65_00455 [Candidatus Bathyarchaeota archaeon]|nr:hypothetical protein [Candidatus Bathyarchaeota archaeon]